MTQRRQKKPLSSRLMKAWQLLRTNCRKIRKIQRGQRHFNTISTQRRLHMKPRCRELQAGSCSEASAMRWAMTGIGVPTMFLLPIQMVMAALQQENWEAIFTMPVCTLRRAFIRRRVQMCCSAMEKMWEHRRRLLSPGRPAAISASMKMAVWMFRCWSPITAMKTFPSMPWRRGQQMR